MAKSLILVSLLIASTLAAESYYDEKFFQSLSNSDFGKTILQTIQLELKNNGESSNTDRVLDMLTNLQTDLSNEQKEADTAFNTDNQKCVAQLTSVNAVIVTANTKKAQLETQLPLFQEEREDKQSQVNDKETEIQRMGDKIQVLTNARESQKEKFDSRRNEMIGLMATLQEVKGSIQNLKTGSFLQMREGFRKEISEHQGKFQRFYKAQEGYNSLVNLLLEVLQDSGITKQQETLNKIVSVSTHLQDTMYEVQKEELLAEEAREKEFQNKLKDFQDQTSLLENQVAFHQSDIEVINQKILELNNDIATQQQVISKQLSQQRYLILKTQRKTIGKGLAMILKTRIKTYHHLGIQKLIHKINQRKEQLSIITEAVEIFSSNYNSRLAQFIQKLKV